MYNSQNMLLKKNGDASHSAGWNVAIPQDGGHIVRIIANRQTSLGP